MLKIGHKYYILILILITVGLFSFLVSAQPVLATNSDSRQVKTTDSPTVYFLSYNGHRKKAYLNPTAYLSYGNHWSDIRTISQSELDSWPTAKLLRTPGQAKIYYIAGAKRTLIKKPPDLIAFHLTGEPILEANLSDLAQYQLVSYEMIGLRTGDNSSPPPAEINSQLKSATLVLTSETITGANNNTFLSNTDNNLVGKFKLRALYQASTINSITISLAGIYNSSVLKKAYIRDQFGHDYQANVNLDVNKRQVIVSFKPALKLALGQERTINLLIDLAKSSFSNQTIRAELKSAQAIDSSALIEAQFPVVDTEFKIFSGDNYVAKVRIEENKISSSGQSINNGSRTIGQFTIYEDSGNENFYLKKIVFYNQGTANHYDWSDFRLLRDGEVIARAKTDDRGKIKFVINYCRVANNYPAQLTVVAALNADYNPQATVNLQVYSLWAVGKVYNFSLPAQINNLNETITLD